MVPRGKNSGGGNMAIFESSQGRFKGGYWDNWDAYVRNSPIAHATKVTTPLVILHNDRDGAVDFTLSPSYTTELQRMFPPSGDQQWLGYISKVENFDAKSPSKRVGEL